MKELSLQDKFLEKAKLKHSGLYSYPDLEYKNGTTKIKIQCDKHTIFEQTPEKHLKGQGCPQCAIENRNKGNASTKEVFISKSIEKHGNKYDYSKVEYINNRTPVCIICPIHKEFMQMPQNHLSYGCQECGGKTSFIYNFIDLCEEKYKEYDYDYTNTEYTGMLNKIKIKCNTHNLVFEKSASKFYHEGQICPRCNKSKKQK